MRVICEDGSTAGIEAVLMGCSGKSRRRRCVSREVVVLVLCVVLDTRGAAAAVLVTRLVGLKDAMGSPQKVRRERTEQQYDARRRS